MIEAIPFFSIAVDGGKSLYNRKKEGEYAKEMRRYLDYFMDEDKRESIKEKTKILVPCHNGSEKLKKAIPNYEQSWLENIMIIDDNSKDDTVETAEKLGINNILSLEKNEGKIGALYEGVKNLEHDTKYVGIFDDDTYFKGDLAKSILFLKGCEEDELKGYDAAALHVLPDVELENLNFIQAYQYFEYMMAMEQKKAMFGKKQQVMNISGCAGLYKRELFENLIKEQKETHNIFEGEDYWRTQKILSAGNEVVMIPKELGVAAKTAIPDKITDLLRQRIKSWSPGRIRTNGEFLKDIKIDRRGGELIYDSIFNVALDPLKVISIPSLFLSGPLLPILFFGFYEGLQYYNYQRYFNEEDKKSLGKYFLLMPFMNVGMAAVRTTGYAYGLAGILKEKIKLESKEPTKENVKRKLQLIRKIENYKQTAVGSLIKKIENYRIQEGNLDKSITLNILQDQVLEMEKKLEEFKEDIKLSVQNDLEKLYYEINI